MTMAAVLLWIRSNWKLVAVGLAVLSLVGYITFLKIEVKHYKTNYENAKSELAAAVHREEELTAANAGITRKYEDSLKTVNAVNDKNLELLNKEITKDAELSSIRVSLNAARLFNQSKRDPSAPVTQAKQGNAGKTYSPREVDYPDYAVGSGSGEDQPGSVKLADIFVLVARNDANHWKCVKQVEAWQGFWGDYEQAVRLNSK